MGRGTETGRALAVLIIAALALVRCFSGIPSWMSDGGWRCALAHHFFHVNWLHLVINCYAVWMIFRNGVRTWHIPAAFAIGTLAYFTALRPTVGLSDMLYAMIGMRSPSYSAAWWRRRNTVIFVCVMAAYLLVPNVSALTHIVSFSGGIAAGYAAHTIKTTSNDYDKAKTKGR